jgi:hypothetical protein
MLRFSESRVPVILKGRMTEVAFFLYYDAEPQLVGFAMCMDDFGARRCGEKAWILRTAKTRDEIWKDLAPFFNKNGTLFMIEISLNRVRYSLPHSFNPDPVKELLTGLES